MHTLGFGALHTRRLCDHPEDLSIYVDTMLSTTWLRQPDNLVVGQRGPLVRRSGHLRRAELRPVVSELLLHERVSSVTLRKRSKSTDELVEIRVESRPAGARNSWSHGAHWVPVAEPVAVDPWAQMIVDFFDATRAPHAVVVVMDETPALSEGWMGGTRRDGVLDHPYPEQFERMVSAHAAGELGTKYVRYPRWGTLYSHTQVAQLGGIAAIEAAVKPAVIRELSAGIYFQITHSVATAATDDALAKQRAFWRVAEPLLPPVA